MNDEQATLWNTVAGRAWVEAQGLVDEMFEPLCALLIEGLPPAARVLDVGCGTGGTTVAAASRLGPAGCAVGVDISEPMIAAARARARDAGSTASFVCADAQRQAFEAAPFDVILSRFGVMFFDDTVQAFDNLRRAARDDAALRLLAWRGPEANPFMTTAERAVAGLLPIPARRPGEPGQFAFADSQRVRGNLEASGWLDIDIRPVDVPCAFPESELIPYVTRFGPVGRALQDADEQTRAPVVKLVSEAFRGYVQDGQVRFTAACWLITARAPAIR